MWIYEHCVFKDESSRVSYFIDHTICDKKIRIGDDVILKITGNEQLLEIKRKETQQDAASEPLTRPAGL